MIFRDRPDGIKVKPETVYSSILPHIMRTRAGSSVWFSNEIDVEDTLQFVKRMNSEFPGIRYSLFGILLSAAVRVFTLKPKLNRFISRRGLYQRREICFSFIVKKNLNEEAPERSAKVYFSQDDCTRDIIRRTNEAIDFLRTDGHSPEEKELRFISRIPGGKNIITRLFRILDSLNLAPASLIRSDPLYTSAYFANMGSLGLKTPYHHLYEWGTASMFVSMGRVYRKECGKGAGRRYITLKITLDERIADGIYFAHASSLLERFMKKPEELEQPPDSNLSGKLEENSPNCQAKGQDGYEIDPCR